MTTPSDEGRAALIQMCAETAVIAAELYSALLSVRIPDGAGRGITNFNGNQAFELTKVLLRETVQEKL